MKLNLLERSILATIAYYDVLDYPLTGFEVFKYLISLSHIVAQSEQEKGLESESLAKPNFLDILKTLKAQALKNFIEEKNGFYFLKARNRIIRTRIERQKISEQKYKKTKNTINLLQFIPYVRMIVISGSLALNNAKKQSDIDLLIVTKHKRIWTVRFLVTLFIHIIGKRRHGRKTINRICLNHYITNKSLKIDFPSLYNAQTYAHLIPVIELEKARLDSQDRVDARRGIYNKFQEANQWIENYLSNYFKKQDSDQRLIKQKKFFRNITQFKEIILNTFLGNVLEKILGFFQKKLIKHHSEKDKGEGRVITDDFQLEFHPASPESKIIDKYNKTMLRLGFRIKPEKKSFE